MSVFHYLSAIHIQTISSNLSFGSWKWAPLHARTPRNAKWAISLVSLVVTGNRMQPDGSVVCLADPRTCPSVGIFNTLRLRQNCLHFADDLFKCIFLNENTCISLTISLKLVRKVRINNIASLIQIMDRRRPGDKSLSEPMMVSLPTHICITRPQWINKWFIIARFMS